MAKMIFDVHPGVAMVQKWVAELPTKTGQNLNQWAKLYRGLAKKHPVRKELVAAIKAEYGLGTINAEQIWEYTFGAQTWDGDEATYLKSAEDYVHGQYAGAKSHFRPLFETIVQYARSLGKDVRVCPCKTMVPLYRSRVFAEMRPATKTRFELALCIDDVPFDDVLKVNPRAKGNDRQRRLITMESIEDFTPTVRKWLKYAYTKDVKP